MIMRPPRSTQSRSSAASDVYKRQGRGSALGDHLGIRERRQLDQPDPIRILLAVGGQQVGGDLEGQACLPTASRACKREEPGRAKQLLHLRDLALSTDEAS